MAFSRIILFFLIIVTGVVCVDAQSTRRKTLRATKTAPKDTVEVIVKPIQPLDTVTDAAEFYSKVRISDFKKAVASRVESVMITNLSKTDTIVEVEVDIDYRTLSGKQLNRRPVSFKVVVPPGETRYASVNSWDRQQLFYHKSTPPTRRSQRSTAFNVTIKPKRLVMKANSNDK